jgi:heptosyltransferase-2
MTHKTLIIGPSWVGDTIMAQGLFKLLKQQSPNSQIDVVAPAFTIGLLSRMPEVGLAIESPFLHSKFKFIEHYRFAQKLRRHKYDNVIILPNSFKSALTPWLAKIKTRTGWLGEHRYFAINDIRYLDKKQYPLMMERYLALGLPPAQPLITPYLYPQLTVSIESRDQLLENNKALKLDRPILAMCIGAEYGESKRWPADYFAEVANTLLASGWAIWLIGSIKERPIAEKIMALTNHACHDLTGKFSLTDIIDLMSLVTGVITNDTGLMHMAAALNKQLIALFGSSSPLFTPPLTNKATILSLKLECQPCFKRNCPLEHSRCLRDLQPQQVLSAVSKWQVSNQE